MSDAPLPLDRMLCFALYSATHAIQHVYKPMLEALGLTYPQYLVLTALWAEDGQRVGQLGAALQLESNTLTPLLKRMENAGLIARTRDTADERQVRVTLAERGRALRAEAGTITGCIVEKTGLSPAELTDLQGRIAGLRDRLRAG